MSAITTEKHSSLADGASPTIATLPPDHPGYSAFREVMSQRMVADLDKLAFFAVLEQNGDGRSLSKLKKLKDDLENNNFFDYAPAITSFLLRDILIQSLNQNQPHEHHVQEMVLKMADLIENNGDLEEIKAIQKEALELRQSFQGKPYPEGMKWTDVEALKHSLEGLTHVDFQSQLLSSSILAYAHKTESRARTNIRNDRFEANLGARRDIADKVIDKITEINDYFSAKASQTDDLSAAGETSAETPVQRSRSRARM